MPEKPLTLAERAVSLDHQTQVMLTAPTVRLVLSPNVREQLAKLSRLVRDVAVEVEAMKAGQHGQ